MGSKTLLPFGAPTYRLVSLKLRQPPGNIYPFLCLLLIISFFSRSGMVRFEEPVKTVGGASNYNFSLLFCNKVSLFGVPIWCLFSAAPVFKRIDYLCLCGCCSYLPSLFSYFRFGFFFIPIIPIKFLVSHTHYCQL